MAFSMIAAVGKNRELGKNGGLIFKLPTDLKFFKETTIGHPVLVGERTFRSLPGVLPGRKHYVLTRKDFETPENVEIIHDLDKFVSENADSDEEIFVIGGGMVYKQMLEHANKLYLTEVEAEDSEADTFFPEFDKSKYNRVELGKGEDNGIKFTFVRYDKIK